MTTAQLITELEKPRKNYPQGVLTWEEGDEAVHKKYDYRFIVIDVEIGSENSPGDELSGRSRKGIKASSCTHSADDPRVLGRVLLAMIPIYGGYQIRDREGGAHISMWDRTPDNPSGNWITESGGLLIEAALRALLAKVEGEQS